MKLKLLAPMAFLLVISSHAVAEDLEIRKANQDMMLCQYKVALKLDDGVSDLNTLAPIIADWCKNESDRFDQIIRSRINGPLDEGVARQHMREHELHNARSIILMKRANERKASRQQ